jgi:hypothetical protein
LKKVNQKINYDILNGLKWVLSLLHIVPFCEGPNEKPKGFAKQKQKT